MVHNYLPLNCIYHQALFYELLSSSFLERYCSMSARYLAGQVFCTLGAPEPCSTFFIYIINGIPKHCNRNMSFMDTTERIQLCPVNSLGHAVMIKTVLAPLQSIISSSIMG